jgi:hypothetical protein
MILVVQNLLQPLHSSWTSCRLHDLRIWTPHLKASNPFQVVAKLVFLANRVPLAQIYLQEKTSATQSTGVKFYGGPRALVDDGHAHREHAPARPAVKCRVLQIVVKNDHVTTELSGLHHRGRDVSTVETQLIFDDIWTNLAVQGTRVGIIQLVTPWVSMCNAFDHPCRAIANNCAVLCIICIYYMRVGLAHQGSLATPQNLRLAYPDTAQS